MDSTWSDSVLRHVRYHVLPRGELCKLYRKSLLGVALTEAIDDMLGDHDLTVDLAVQLMHEFDAVIAKLFSDIKQRDQHKEVIKSNILSECQKKP